MVGDRIMRISGENSYKTWNPHMILPFPHKKVGRIKRLEW